MNIDQQIYPKEQNQEPIDQDLNMDNSNNAINGEKFGFVIRDDQPVIRCWDFRYTDTLRIYFNYPLGVASCIDCNSMGLSSNEFRHYEERYKDICDAFHAALSRYNIELDWRDEFELEIHHVDPNKFHSNRMRSLDKILSGILRSKR